MSGGSRSGGHQGHSLLLWDRDLEAVFAGVSTASDQAVVLAIQNQVAVVHEWKLLKVLTGERCQHRLSLGSCRANVP